MRKGVNINFIKLFFEFDKLLVQAVEAVQLKELSVLNDKQREKYISIGKLQINDNEDNNSFWIRFELKEKNKHKYFCIVLEFDSIVSSFKFHTNAKKLAGTLGKYYSKVECEESFTILGMDLCIRFYLKNEYFKQFYDENIDKDTQLKILTGFISEVLEKCGKKLELKEICSDLNISKEILWIKK